MSLSKCSLPALGLLVLASALSAGEKPAGDIRPARDLHGDPLPAGASARYGTIRLRHAQTVSQIAFVDGGRLLASGGDDGTVRLWNPADGREVECWSVPRCKGLAASADGRVLAAHEGNDQQVRLYDVSRRKELGRVRTKEWLLSVALSANGKYLATGLYPKGLSLWDAPSGRKLQDLPAKPASYSLAFSPDGKMLAVGGDWGYITLWDVPTGKLLRKLEGQRQVVWGVAFSPDGKALASVGQDETFRLWDCATGKEVRRFVGHEGRITAVAFAPDGKTVASGGQDDGTVRLWDPVTGRERAKLGGHGGAITSLAFAPDGGRLASAAGHAIRLWDAWTGRELLPREGHQREVDSVAYSADGKLLLSAGKDGAVRVWDAAGGKQVREIPCFGHNAQAAISPDGKTLAVTAGDYNRSRVALINWPSGRPRFELAGWRPFAFSPDGKFLAACGLDGISLWDTATGKATVHLPGGGTIGKGLAFSADGKLLAAARESGSWRVWDLPGGKMRLRFPQPPGAEPLHAMALSPDGRWLALGSQTDLRLADLAAGGQLYELPGWKPVAAGPPQRGKTGGPVPALAFSTDGKMLAAGDGRDILLWELFSGRERAHLEGHYAVRSVAFAPDGGTLASGGGDGQVLAWDVWERGRAADLTPEALETLWQELADRDAARAFRAMRKLASAPRATLPLLRSRLQPVPREVSPAVARLLSNLDDDRFEVRKRAEEKLLHKGDEAEAALARTLAGNPSAEVRTRVERIRRKLKQAGPSPGGLRSCRAVEVLERLGSVEAREALRPLADGAPEARLTQEAAQALGRMSRRPRTELGGE